MTKRSVRYFAAKKDKVYMNSMHFKIRMEALRTMFRYGVCGTRMFIREDGNVGMKNLSIDEIMDIKQRQEQGECISEEYTICDGTEYLLSTEANRKSIEQGLKEAALIHDGKLKGKTFDEFLDEL